MNVLGHPAVLFSRGGGACPEQYEGLLRDGQSFYFRYRYGSASLGVGDTRDYAISDPKHVQINHGDNMQGIFGDFRTRNQVFAELLRQLVAAGRVRPLDSQGGDV
jgi:hypothetical protein